MWLPQKASVVRTEKAAASFFVYFELRESAEVTQAIGNTGSSVRLIGRVSYGTLRCVRTTLDKTEEENKLMFHFSVRVSLFLSHEGCLLCFLSLLCQKPGSVNSRHVSLGNLVFSANPLIH